MGSVCLGISETMDIYWFCHYLETCSIQLLKQTPLSQKLSKVMCCILIPSLLCEGNRVIAPLQMELQKKSGIKDFNISLDFIREGQKTGHLS